MATTQVMGQVSPVNKTKHALDLCGTAIDQEIKVNNLQRQIIKDEDARFQAANQVIVQDSAWYRNPWFLIALGLVAGSVGTVYAEKHL